ncbi:MAG: hypothetical protein JO332_19260 [Planctomycetaceae bacterium]|nr:hypothetical protein [Planctomycetaceae bacterium]
MERKRVVALAIALAAAVGMASGAFAQDKKGAGAGETGPYGPPTLAQVKEKVKPTEEEAKKIEEIYTAATKAEGESKARAKENGTDRKTLEGYLTIGRNETVNKVKEVLDKEKSAEFDKLCAGAPTGKKKK